MVISYWRKITAGMTIMFVNLFLINIMASSGSFPEISFTPMPLVYLVLNYYLHFSIVLIIIAAIYDSALNTSIYSYIQLLTIVDVDVGACC